MGAGLNDFANALSYLPKLSSKYSAKIFDFDAALTFDFKEPCKPVIKMSFYFDAHFTLVIFSELGPVTQGQSQLAMSPSANQTRAHEQLGPALLQRTSQSFR